MSKAKWFIITPILVTVGVWLFTMVYNNSKSLKWSANIIYPILSIIASSIISGILYYFLVIRQPKDTKRQFNSREFCEKTIYNEFYIRRHINLRAFTKITDSFYGSGNYGDRKFPLDMIFRASFKSQTNPPQYLFVAMNMEMGKEDWMAQEFKPSNITQDEKERMFYDMCNRLCEHPEDRRTRESTIFNPMLGSYQTQKTDEPLKDDKEDEYEEEAE